MIKSNYLPEAKEYFTEFKAIISRFGTIEESDTPESLYEELSTGDRFKKFTIYEFRKDPDGRFYFSEGNFGVLSGSGSSSYYTFDENKKIIKIENDGIYMS